MLNNRWLLLANICSFAGLITDSKTDLVSGYNILLEKIIRLLCINILTANTFL